MFESKMTTKSGWGEMSSINSSSAPGFVPIPCPSHGEYSITNICKAPNCIEPLCPECISAHVQLHQESKKPAKIENILTTRTACIEQLAKMKYDASKEIEESISNSSGNIEQFVESHQRRLDTAHKKILKMIDEMFVEMNKQMQVISNAFMAEKEKREKQIRVKLSPLNDFLTRVTEYKQELESDDYIPALIELLNEPPRKPKFEALSETQNYGSVEINEKYLEDIKVDISKFVKVVVNCKDEGLKGRIEINKSQFNGSNNMKFSRFDRSKSRDGSESRLGDTRRSNSKKKIFGNESAISDIRPTTNSTSRAEMNNSIYQGLNQDSSVPQKKPINSNKLQEIRYSSYSTPIKVNKSYFTNHNCSLWYFKEGSKNVFKACLECIEAGFEKFELSIGFLIPDGHSTVTIPNGSAFLMGGEFHKDGNTTNKMYKISDQDFNLREVAPMNVSRSFFGACYFQDSIYVAGGLTSELGKWGSNKCTSEVERYVISENRWEKCCPLPEPSSHFTIHAFNSGKLIKLGGLTEAKVFLNKIDVYSIFRNEWSSLQPDNRFTLTVDPGVAQVSNESLVIFGGKIPNNGEKISKCYILNEESNGQLLNITDGPELYNEATFESAFAHEGSIIAIQNNEQSNRNKLIMGYKYEQWKFVAC